MDTQNLITEAIKIAGLVRLARACNVTYPALRKWEKAGRLPRTEWTGESDYASVIERETGGKITREQLLQIPARPQAAIAAAPVT